MPSWDSAAAFLGRHKFFLAAGGVGTAAGGVGALRGWREDPSASTGDKFGRAANYATGAAFWGAAGTMGAVTLYPAARELAGPVSRRVGSYFSSAWAESTAQKSFGKAFFGRAPIAAGVGGVLGAVIGSQVADDPKQGAVIGAGVGVGGGLAVRSILRGNAAWKMIGKVPGAKAATLVAGAVGVGAVARATLSEPQYESESVASRDGMGGYETSGVQNRMAAMNLHGDIVLGLHNKRH